MTVQDIFALRKQGKIEEAEKIYKALLRLIPSIEDDPEHKAKGFMHYAEGRLIKISEKFRKRYFAIRDKKKHQVADNEVINISHLSGRMVVGIISAPR